MIRKDDGEGELQILSSKSRDSITFFQLCRAIASLILDSAMNQGESVSTTASVLEIIWSSYKELTADTLAHRGDEGRGYLR